MFRLRFILFFVVLPFFFSCRPARISNENAVYVGVETYPATFDPRLSTDAFSGKIGRFLYAGLFRLGSDLQWAPDLAQSFQWKSSTILEITLKPDLVFQNGMPLTASDVVATYNSLKRPDLHSPLANFFDLVSEIKERNPQTIEIILKAPFAPIFSNLSLGILPKEIAEGEFQMVGSGPYRLKEAIDQQKIVLEKVNDSNAPLLVFRTILDDNLRTLELIKGRLDLVQNAIPWGLLKGLASPGSAPVVPQISIALQSMPDQCGQHPEGCHFVEPLEPPPQRRFAAGIDQVPLKYDLTLQTGPGIQFSYLGLNLKNEILKNKSVREALALALNRDLLIQYKMAGLGIPAGSLLFPEHWAANPHLPQVPYNPKRAKEILDEAGYPDPDGDGPKPRFKLTYKTSTKKDRVELALLISDFWKQIGVEVEVKSYEFGTFFRDIRNGNFEIFSLTWVGITEPDIYYYAFHSTQIPPAGVNRGFYSNEKIDHLVEEGRRELDVTDRKLIYREVQQILANDLPYIPLWYEKNWVVMGPRISNYTLRPDAGFEGLMTLELRTMSNF